MRPLNFSKPMRTRDGFPVRILCTDAKGKYPIVGLVDLGESEYARHWMADGKADFRRNVTTNYDLMEDDSHDTD